MGRGAGGYVNLLSHSPVDTPCPGYRYRESREALLEEVAPLVATTPPAICDVGGRADVLCPVQIHVHDPVIRERRRQGAEREEPLEQRRETSNEDRVRKWIDLDENVLDGYILIDDGYLEPGAVPAETEEVPYPEGAEEADDDDEDDEDSTGSHGKDKFSIYNRMRRGSCEPNREDFDLSTTYPLANSHGNNYQESSSHNKYRELYSEISVRNYLEAGRDEPTNYSMANSHGDHNRISAEDKDRNCRDNLEIDRIMWDSRPHTNYEIANSHSNYRVYYDSQTQQQQQQDFMQTSGWTAESWREQQQSNTSTCTSTENGKQLEGTKNGEAGTTKDGEADCKSSTEQNIEPTCDIEQCLVQIEESLLNIEQNLLHVQDLDIPELRNLLYKSPSIERSLFEVQDLLYPDGIVPVIKRNKSVSLESEEAEEEDDDEEEEEEEVEEEEVWVGPNITVKDNDDDDDNAGAAPFDASNEESSDTANQEESNSSQPVDDRSNIDCVDGVMNSPYNADVEKAMNFVPNSLNKTIPRRIVLDETKENIRLCSSEPEEHTSIDYNLNSTCAEKKLLCREKCHSRTNSLDENSSTFQNLDSVGKHETGKISLQNLFFESTINRLDISGKAKSEGTLETSREKSQQRRSRRGSDEDHWLAIEAKAEDFRKKIESIASQQRSALSAGLDGSKRTTKISKGSAENIVSRSREKSPNRPRRNTNSAEKTQDKDKESGSGKSFDKRKRKKLSTRTQNSMENALVPSKLISLSLSILLAALLQAVRCLTDLVEDAFKSVSYDRSGLLQ